MANTQIDKKGVDQTPDTANERLQNGSIRHQVGVRRFTAGEVKRVNTLLTKADRELSRRLRERLEAMAGKPPDFTSERWRRLRDDIREARKELMKQARRQVRGTLVEMAAAEQQFEKRLFEVSIPVQLEYATASIATITAAVRTKPFSGGANAARTLQQWFDSVRAADQRRILEAIQLGLTQQETVDQIVARVRGTAERAFRDGTLAQTRRNMEAVVRTAINHVSGVGREEFHKANEDIVQALRWNSTLDGRTSLICAGRDGKFAPISGTDTRGIPEPHLDPPTARNPAHPNCRSVMIALLTAEGVEQVMPARPFVRDTKTRRWRQANFARDTRDRVGDKRWSSMSRQQRVAATRQTRLAWAEENIGSVPGQTNYDTWLRKQPAAFQDEVLGPTRGKAFRKGMRVDEFTDREGNELTLAELKADDPEFF